LFRHPSDRLPVAIITVASVIDLAAYFLIDSLWVLATYWAFFALPKGLICAWSHHHQHVHTFRHALPNRLYEVLLALHTGICTNLWVLHHNLGHHLNFLDQSKDESAWKRKDGSTMGELEYTAIVASTAYFRALQVGKRHPKHRKVFLRWTAITVTLVAALVWLRPMPGIFIFALPMLVSLTFTSWATYDHHAGLDTKNGFEASYNIMNPVFNVLTGNLGYHTAHHHRQGMHWSKLPELHASIAHEIPEQLYLRPTFEVLFPSRTAVREK
jgi:fatty acid desaturase